MKTKRHPNFKGGRVLAEHGYVLIFVGKAHHLADCRGYAYEHRLVAEKKLGRRLRPGEEVHHKNEVKSDNKPRNIVVKGSKAAHFEEHRKPGSKRQKSDESNPTVSCACGCGKTFRKFDADKRPRKFAHGHWRRGVKGGW